ncbi:MAG: hypothetical protein WA688_00595 [Thermoplasmata archaeon]
MTDEDHPIDAWSKAPLGDSAYYIRRMSLKDVGTTFAARADVVPWPAPRPRAGATPSGPTEISVILAYGGAIPLMAQSLSILNLLVLQGKVVHFKRVGDDLYCVDKIETLAGDAFREAMESEYGPR